MDPNYEAEEMETNMENLFEHVNQMSNTEMPRDFLASMTRHFLRGPGEKYTTFQKYQTEACLLLEQRRPHWRKRKTNSASQFLSMFYLIEQDVIESNDDVVKSLFVEGFNSREAYVESLMEEFDETDRIEKMMSTGNALKVPGFIYDDDDTTTEAEESTTEFDINNCMLEVADIIEDLGPVDKSKYVKVFEKDGEASVGIHNSRIKALANRKSGLLSPFPQSVKFYPKQVKSGTKTFTKLTATSSVGASNTSAGYCMMINVVHLSSEVKSRILAVLGRDDLFDEALAQDETNEDSEGDLIQSQDFPNMFQSQTSETLLHCTLCEFMCRSKVEFEEHIAVHPSCSLCKKQLENNSQLEEHMKDNHYQEHRKCEKCGKEIALNEFEKHEKDHEMFEGFKKTLDKTAKSSKAKQKPQTKDKKKPKAINCYNVFAEERRSSLKASNPSLTPVEITRKISEEWKKLSEEEKKVFKERAAGINRERLDDNSERAADIRLDDIEETVEVNPEGSVDCPKCEVKVQS